jgi:hypothetical protein
MLYIMKIVKSHITAANTSTQIEVRVRQPVNMEINESKARQKRGRLIGVKYILRGEKHKDKKSVS